MHPDFRLYLETSGIHHEATARLRDMVDVVSMDFKLPTASGQGPHWEEHKNFLLAAAGRNVFVKIVVTKDTAMEDIITAATIIARNKPDTILIIQPASGLIAPVPGRLIEFQDAALAIIPDVRVIPQVHKLLGLP
jgi:organic radical activating enzyme